MSPSSEPNRRGSRVLSSPGDKRLPTAEEAKQLLLSWQDGLLRRHLGIRRPDELGDAEYSEALEEALAREYPRPPPKRTSRRRRGARR